MIILIYIILLIQLSNKPQMDNQTKLAWKAYKDGDGIWKVEEGGFGIFETTHPREEYREHIARIGAAAPDLLEALQGAMNALEAFSSRIHPSVIITARNAIKKATIKQ